VRHRTEAKYALAAKFLDVELMLSCPACAAARGAPVSGALARGRGRGRPLRRSAATAELLDVVVRAPRVPGNCPSLYVMHEPMEQRI